jgi:hypothetical protein
MFGRKAWIGGLLAGWCCVGVVSGSAQAQTGEDVREENLQASLGDKDLSPAPPGFESSLEQFAKLWDELDFFGDLRLRYESDYNRNKDFDTLGNPSDDSRNRGRFRLRFGLRYPVQDDLLFETGLRTNSEDDDPRDDDVDLGDAWRVSDIGLDLLNLTYRPGGFDGFFARAGKFHHIFENNPVMGSLVWDPDVNPEGAALGYALNMDDSTLESFRLVVGEYLAVEQDRNNDVLTFAAQATCRLALSEDLGAQAGVGYVGFSNPTPDGNTDLLVLDSGNFLIPGDFYSEFSIYDSYLALDFDVADIPFVVSGGWIANTGARINQDHGWTLGVAAGELREPGDLRAFYQYQEIEQDALFTPVARADFARLTNYEGSAAGVGWRVSDAVEWGATLSWVKAIKRQGGLFTLPRHETRFRLDLLVTF